MEVWNSLQKSGMGDGQKPQGASAQSVWGPRFLDGQRETTRADFQRR